MHILELTIIYEKFTLTLVLILKQVGSEYNIYLLLLWDECHGTSTIVYKFHAARGS